MPSAARYAQVSLVVFVIIWIAELHVQVGTLVCRDRRLELRHRQPRVVVRLSHQVARPQASPQLCCEHVRGALADARRPPDDCVEAEVFLGRLGSGTPVRMYGAVSKDGRRQTPGNRQGTDKIEDGFSELDRVGSVQ